MRHLIATALLCLLASNPAQAARHPNGQQFCRVYSTDAGATAFRCWTKAGARKSARSFRGRHRVAHARRHHGRAVAGRGDIRPIAWCGWYMRQILGVADQGYNLARKWASWGRPAMPAPGVVVVWPHHVGMITGRHANGNWIVKSGNDGHRVRERPRSVARAIAFRAG